MTGCSLATFINEPGFYELVFNSKLDTAKEFRNCVFSQVLPSIKKYGQYKLFDNPNKNMFKIENETDLHYKVVQYIRRIHPESIIVAGLGELQDTCSKRINSWNKGYMKGQPDISHKDYSGSCIEFKSPTNNYHVSESQNGYLFKISNDYDKIIHDIIINS